MIDVSVALHALGPINYGNLKKKKICRRTKKKNEELKTMKTITTAISSKERLENGAGEDGCLVIMQMRSAKTWQNTKECDTTAAAIVSSLTVLDTLSGALKPEVKRG